MNSSMVFKNNDWVTDKIGKLRRDKEFCAEITAQSAS